MTYALPKLLVEFIFRKFLKEMFLTKLVILLFPYVSLFLYVSPSLWHPLWCTYKTYSLRTLAPKWSGFLWWQNIFPSLWCVKSDDRMFLLLWCRQVLLTQFHWVCRVSELEDAEASVEPPWNLDWVRECAIWVDSFTVDDRLPTRLTYGVKGPHMISREVEGEVCIAALPQPTSTPTVARTVG